jgi:hypothetical protein
MLDAWKAVLWSMLGIRSKKGYDEDRSKLTFKQILIAALVSVFVFILSLIFLVKFITAK